MSVSYDAVIEQSRKYLEFIAKEEMTKEEKDWVVHEAVEGFRDNVNLGFIEYSK